MLNLQAIAMKDEELRLSNNKVITRRVGEILNLQLESQFTLEIIKNNLKSYNFEEQYQQDPIPEEENILKRKWFEYYDELPSDGMIIQSWDTASSDSNFSHYFVGITALFKDKKFYIIDISREVIIS